MKKIFKVILCLLCASVLVLVPFVRIGKNSKIQDKKQYKAILQIWNIDSFEGGIGSRTSFLRRVCLKFSSEHKEVLCLVENHTVKSANDLLKKGKIPDLISSGICGIESYKYLSEIKINSNSDGGIINGSRYFVAWCKGGYFEIKRKGVKISESVVKCENWNSSATAILLNHETYENLVFMDKDTAFNYFLSKENVRLIGTQRDVIKIKNKNLDCEITPLTKYNDLYQYISLTSQNSLKKYYSELFINFLLSKKIQEKLVEINLISNKYKNLTEEDFYLNYEKEDNVYSLSPLLSENDIKGIISLSKNNVLDKRDKDEVIKLLKQLKNS